MISSREASTRPVFLASAGLVIVGLIVGGTSRPLNDLILLLAALPLLFITLSDRAAPPPSWTVKWTLGLFALALVQLVPLPPAIWPMLPGRELAASAMLASGNELGWRPIALNPGAAAVGFLTLVAPITLHVAVTRLDAASVKRLLAIVAGGALLSAIFGIMQRLSRGLSPYETEHLGAAIGFFVNRNHHADLLIAGMLLVTTLFAATRRKEFQLAASAAVALLVFGVIATTSRAGIILSVPAALAALLMIWRPSLKWSKWLILAALVAMTAIYFIPAFSIIFERFGTAAEDQRLTMARDSLVATRAMWPVGSGYGSFVPVYMAYEDLDLLEARYVVAAHNDYLQLAFEGGIAGVLTGAAVLAAMALLAWNMGRRNAHSPAWAAWGVAAILLAHSMVDFPLRTGTLAIVFALCTAASQISSKSLRKPRQEW